MKKSSKKIKKVSKVKRRIKEIAPSEVPSAEGKKDTSEIPPEEGRKKKEETLEEQLDELTEITPRPQAHAIDIESSTLNQIEQGEQETFKLEEGVGNAPVTKVIEEEPKYSTSSPQTSGGDYQTTNQNTMEPARIATPHVEIAQAHLETSPQVREMHFKAPDMVPSSNTGWVEDYESRRPERSDPTLNRPTGLQTEKKYQVKQ